MDKRSAHTAFRFGRQALLLVAAALLAVCSGCSEPNAEAPSTTGVHPQLWNNTRFSQAGTFHGSAVDRDGTDACRRCHGSDLEGSAKIPGCFSCHFDAEGGRVPPGSGWSHGSEGHSDLQDYSSVCNECHRVERAFGTGPAACHDCHGPGANHVLGKEWLDKKSPLFHGDGPLDNCSGCHDLSVKCYECHFGATGGKAPPGTGWNHGYNEEHEDYSAVAAVCNRCHALNRSYGNPPSTCHDCNGDGDDD